MFPGIGTNSPRWLNRPLTHITPLSLSDGATYERKLDWVYRYISDWIVPQLDGKLDEWFDQYKADHAALLKDIADEKTRWQELFDAFINNIVIELEALNDIAVANLVRNTSSALRDALDDNFASKETQTTVESGRLSSAAVVQNIIDTTTTKVDDQYMNTQTGIRAMATRPDDMTAPQAGGYENTGFGYESLKDNKRGWKNTSFGASAMRDNVDGYLNSAFGNSALERTIGGIGTASPFTNAPGSRNSAFGSNALRYNTVGRGNVAMGRNAAHSNISGNYNTALGTNAWSGVVDGDVHSNKTASYGVAIGWGAGFNADADDTVAVGSRALYETRNPGSWGCTAVGHYALASSEARENTALGRLAGSQVTTGQWNIAVGARVMSASSGVTGQANTGIGTAALPTITEGSYNIGIGQETLRGVSSGNRNVVIGHQSSMDVNAAINNTVVVGAGAKASHAGAVSLGADTESSNTSQVHLGGRSLSMRVRGSRPASQSGEVVVWYELTESGTHQLRCRFPGSDPITIASF